MSAKFLEPQVIDPRELVAGDQVGLVAVDDLHLLVGDPHGSIDEVWLELRNDPGETTHVWGERVPVGSVALDLARYGWKVLPLPQVWARKKIN